MVLIESLGKAPILSKLLTSKIQVLFGDGLMLLVARWLASNQGPGAFTPLPVHEIWFIELVFEEPIHVGRTLGLACLTSDDEAFCVAAFVVAGLRNLVQEVLDLFYIVHHHI